MLSGKNQEIDLLAVAPAVGARHSAQAERLKRGASRSVEAMHKALLAEGVHARNVVKVGSPARVLIGASGSYDLTVIAAKSHKSDSSTGLGPVASRLAEHANQSVLIARQTPDEARGKILVAVDGSEGSFRAIDTLTQIADLSGADVTLLHVVETPWLHAGPDQEWLGYEEEKDEAIDPQAQWEREFEQEAERVLVQSAERFPARTGLTTLTYRGLPAEEIISEAERGEYGLVVVGASGSTDLKHQMLGSVSSKIAWNVPCSVLLVW
jgi:nucleotide-binding universal stress UspA family protein